MTDAGWTVVENLLMVLFNIVFYGSIAYGLYRYAKFGDGILAPEPGPWTSIRDQMPAIVPAERRDSVAFVHDPRYEGDVLQWEEQGYTLRVAHRLHGDGEGVSSAIRATLTTQWTGRAMSRTQLERIASATPRPRAVRGWEFGPTACVVRIRPSWRSGRTARRAAVWLLSVLEAAEDERRQDIPD